MRSNRRSFILRVRFWSGLFVAAALLLIVRLYFVQIVHGQMYSQQAMGQYVAPNSDTRDRGTIYLTNKDREFISAAVMQSGWRIAVQPQNVTNIQLLCDRVNTVVQIDRERCFTIGTKGRAVYEEIAYRLDTATAARVRGLQIPGVILVNDEWRVYPGGELASNALGFVGFRGNDRVGLYGLERQYQDTLAQPPQSVAINPFAEIFTNIAALAASDPATSHGNIVTSLDPNVEKQLESTLDGVVTTYTPKLTGGIVMDPHTGAILAMAVRPSFDPNTYNLETNTAVFANRLVDGRYELGSIMKPLTMAVGIDTGAVTPETTYNDTGCATVSTKTICDYDSHVGHLRPRGTTSMQEVLNHSLNLGAAFVERTVGNAQFTTYLHTLEFDQKTGIDFPNEVSGDISILGAGKGPDVNYATAAFGQGVSISPIGMIRALSALSNGGVIPSPHIVTGIKYDNGITRSVTVPDGVRVFKQSTADTVTNMLVQVFDKALLNGTIKQDHYTMAAKTGTAQIPKPGGGYYDVCPVGKCLHSFFGYFPAHDAKVIVFLFAVEPHGVQYAANSLAKPYLEIAKFLINYYNIPPDR